MTFAKGSASLELTNLGDDWIVHDLKGDPDRPRDTHFVIAEVLAFADHHGIELACTVRPGNPVLRRMYRKLGFEKTATILKRKPCPSSPTS